MKVRSRQADEEEDFVGGRLSKQILSEAKKQLQEINEEEEKAGPGAKAAKGATVLEPPKVRQDQFWQCVTYLFLEEIEFVAISPTNYQESS